MRRACCPASRSSSPRTLLLVLVFVLVLLILEEAGDLLLLARPRELEASWSRRGDVQLYQNMLLQGGANMLWSCMASVRFQDKKERIQLRFRFKNLFSGQGRLNPTRVAAISWTAGHTLPLPRPCDCSPLTTPHPCLVSAQSRALSALLSAWDDATGIPPWTHTPYAIEHVFWSRRGLASLCAAATVCSVVTCGVLASPFLLASVNWWHRVIWWHRCRCLEVWLPRGSRWPARVAKLLPRPLWTHLSRVEPQL